jgi:hypothetical protein
MNKVQIICIIAILFISTIAKAQNKSVVNPNVNVSAIFGEGDNSFGASFFVLSNKEKHGQVGAGIGFYPIPRADVYIPVFTAARIKFTDNKVQPMIDINIGYGIYSSHDITGRLYTNAGVGAMFPGKRVQPFVMFKYELKQFQIKTYSRARTIYNNNYFNASIGISL